MRRVYIAVITHFSSTRTQQFSSKPFHASSPWASKLKEPNRSCDPNRLNDGFIQAYAPPWPSAFISCSCKLLSGESIGSGNYGGSSGGMKNLDCISAGERPWECGGGGAGRPEQ